MYCDVYNLILDRSALVHSLLKYKFLCSRAPDDDAGKKDTEMMSKDEKEEKETSPEKPQRKEPIKVHVI